MFSRWICHKISIRNVYVQVVIANSVWKCSHITYTGDARTHDSSRKQTNEWMNKLSHTKKQVQIICFYYHPSTNVTRSTTKCQDIPLCDLRVICVYLYILFFFGVFQALESWVSNCVMIQPHIFYTNSTRSKKSITVKVKDTHSAEEENIYFLIEWHFFSLSFFFPHLIILFHFLFFAALLIR